MDKDTFNSIRVTGIAGALTELLGVQPPASAEVSASLLSDFALEAFGGTADRVFMYNPDAVAMWIFQKYTSLFADVFRHTQLGLPLATVMPSVTPVCFASMYTGAFPQVHGIKNYTKPVLQTDTVFDALIRAGKKPAIVSTSGDSISKIFLERSMDYFISDTIDECNAKALELIEKDEHDLIVLYNGNYDGAMHKFAPEGKESIEALKENVAAFDAVASKIKVCWQKHNTILGFAPDHGCHEIDGGAGSHGLEMPEDINIMHFYGAYPRR